MKKFFSVRKFTKALAFFLPVFLFFINASFVSGSALDEAPLVQPTKGITIDEKGLANGDIATFKYFETIFGSVISVALALAGIVLFVMFLVGGFRFITSGGDPKAVEGAKGTLTHAILGLIVVVLAFVILKVISDITGVTGILNFQVFQVPKP